MKNKEVNLYRIITTYFNHKLLTQEPLTPYSTVIRSNINIFNIVGEHYDKMQKVMKHFNVGEEYKDEFYNKTIDHLYFHVDKYIGDLNTSKNR